jgi:hypothetical protein
MPHVFATARGASDGANPAAGLISDTNGALYGTTQGGGNGNAATPILRGNAGAIRISEPNMA